MKRLLGKMLLARDRISSGMTPVLTVQRVSKNIYSMSRPEFLAFAIVAIITLAMSIVFFCTCWMHLDGSLTYADVDSTATYLFGILFFLGLGVGFMICAGFIIAELINDIVRIRIFWFNPVACNGSVARIRRNTASYDDIVPIIENVNDHGSCRPWIYSHPKMVPVRPIWNSESYNCNGAGAPHLIRNSSVMTLDHTKVIRFSTHRNFYMIMTDDGNIGWVEEDNLDFVEIPGSKNKKETST